jgi:hypothetical protein
MISRHDHHGSRLHARRNVGVSLAKLSAGTSMIDPLSPSFVEITTWNF